MEDFSKYTCHTAKRNCENCGRYEIVVDSLCMKCRSLAFTNWIPKDHTAMPKQGQTETPEPMPKGQTINNAISISCRDPKSRYYGSGGIDVMDVIKAKLTPDQFKGWLLGNLIKYSCRANYKDQFGRDIEKVNFYSKELFNILEN